MQNPWMLQHIALWLIRQKDSMDCGPSCLAMVAAYYGCQLDLAVLRERCFLAKDGVSLLGLSRAAEQIGFRTVGGRITFEVLANKAPLPCIAVLLWTTSRLACVC